MLQAPEDVALAYLSAVSASGKLLAPTVSCRPRHLCYNCAFACNLA